MKNNTRTTILTGAMVGAVAMVAQAGLTYTTSPTLTSWLGNPIYTSIANAGLGAATTPQGFGGNVAAGGVAATGFSAETFTAASSFTLAAFNIMDGGSSGDTIGVHLYDVTSTIGSNNGSTTQGSGANYGPAGLVDLFSGLTFNLTSNGEVQGIYTLSGADQVALTSGHIYSLEFSVPASSPGGNNAFVWFRGAAVATDGQMMLGDSTDNPSSFGVGSRVTLSSAGVAGGAPRTATLALYATAVPEPASLALLGLGALAGTIMVRRQKK